MLSSLQPGYRALLFGAGGGIGTALVEALLEDPALGELTAFSRSPNADAFKADPRLSLEKLDICSEAELAAAAQRQEGREVDLLIVASGLLHEPGLMPEKSIRALDPAQMQRLFAVNSIAPLQIAHYFQPHMRRDHKTVFAALSARVGSIGDNRLGGWYSYRASKAALNMLLKCLAIECQRRWPRLVVAGLHPGTVKTGLSEPFRSKVPEEKLFSPQFAAQALLQVIDQLTVNDSGGCFAWDGKAIPA